MRVHLFIVFLLLCQGCISTSNLSRGKLAEASPQPVLTNFETESGLIVLKAKVNGVEGRFVFDNGFSYSAMNADFAQRAGVEFKKSSGVRDANNQRGSFPIANADTLELSGHTFVKTGFYQIDTKVFLPCGEVDGIIGASVINQVNWDLNFLDKTARVSSQPFDAEGIKLDIKFSNNNSSFVDLVIKEQTVPSKIDFGSTGAIKVRSQTGLKIFEGDSAQQLLGAAAFSAFGLGKPDTSYQFWQPVALNSSQGEMLRPGILTLRKNLKYPGYLGVGYFKDYRVIINSTKKQYILSEASSTNLKSSPKVYGVVIYPIEDSWKVIRVQGGDPMLKGLAPGDEVLTLDGESVSRFKDICAFKEYMKTKRESQEPLTLTTKEHPKPVKLPYRSPRLVKIE